MKKLLSIVCALAFTFSVSGQVKTPQPSPASKVEQKVGLTDVAINYSRPSMRERVIFGDLVPYGKTWRTGANQNTTIEFSDDVTIGGKTVAAGKYSIYTVPNAESWDVMFYTDTENWGNPKEWDDAKVAAKVTVPVVKLPMKVETFTITFDDLTDYSASIGFIWEDTMANVQFTVPTEKLVGKTIANAFAGNGYEPKLEDYYEAAVYYGKTGQNLEDAVKWIDKAVEMTNDKPRFWYIHQQALIHNKAGKKKSAIAAAKRSLELAKEAKYDAYIKKNEELLAKLGA